MNNIIRQLKELQEGALTIPNFLSAVRIILIPVFIILFYHGYVRAAFIILVVSGLTDFIDGKIARNFNQISALGKLLDPAADKLTQITIAVMLYLEFNKASDKMIYYFSYVFLLFLAKEALMLIGSFVLLAMNLRPVAAELPGKIATFTFYAVMTIVIAFGPGFGAFSKIWVIPDYVLMIMVVVSASFTIIAFLSYIPDTIAQVKMRKNEKMNTIESGKQ